jgi:hypothetical protein
LVIPVGEVPGDPESKFPQISLHLSCVRQPADMSPPGYKLPCQVFTSRNCQVNNDKQLPTGFQCLAYNLLFESRGLLSTSRIIKIHCYSGFNGPELMKIIFYHNEDQQIKTSLFTVCINFKQKIL